MEAAGCVCVLGVGVGGAREKTKKKKVEGRRLTRSCNINEAWCRDVGHGGQIGRRTCRKT